MPHRILLVEDSRTQATRIQLELLRHGVSVEVVGDGVRGLEMARARQPDAVILDVELPGMDGFAICRALKADAATAHIPILMLTQRDAARDTMIGLDAGAVDYIPKDAFAEDNLVESLRQLGLV